jgi:hypothetical protein
MSEDWIDKAISAGATRREAAEKAEKAAQESTQSEETTANELWRQLRAAVETDVDRHNRRVAESDRIGSRYARLVRVK